MKHSIGTLVPERAAIAFSAMHRHKKRLGIYPNLIHPKTFNEKVLHRMVFDRRPILNILQDKHAVRRYVRDRIGEHVLPRLYWVTKNPADIPFEQLPNRFVIKATHGCAFNYLVPDKARLNREDVVAKCKSWLASNYYEINGEWAYKHIEPRIIIEEFIDDGTGPTPTDYKCYVFGGRVQMIEVSQIIPGNTQRFLNQRRDYYSRSWDQFQLTTPPHQPIGGVPRPRHFDELIQCAETLAQGLDFLRVDLYDGDKVYFGETAPYPVSGIRVFVPKKWDRYFGDFWSLSFGAIKPTVAARRPSV